MFTQFVQESYFHPSKAATLCWSVPTYWQEIKIHRQVNLLFSISSAFRVTVPFPNSFIAALHYVVAIPILSIFFFSIPISFPTHSTYTKSFLNLLMNTGVGLINYCKINLQWRSRGDPLQPASLFIDKLLARYFNHFYKRFFFASSLFSLN